MDDFFALAQAVDDFCQLIENLPPETLQEKTWGPQAILAHLVYYHELYVKQAQAFLDDTPTKLFQGPYYELNAQVVKNCRRIPIPILVRRFQSANRRLGKIYRACDPEQVIVPIKQGVQPHRLDKLVRAVTSHVRNHQRQIEKDWVRRKPRARDVRRSQR